MLCMSINYYGIPVVSSPLFSDATTWIPLLRLSYISPPSNMRTSASLFYNGKNIHCKLLTMFPLIFLHRGILRAGGCAYILEVLIEIGHQFPNSSDFPSLEIGITLAFFRQAGKWPRKKHLLSFSSK